MTLHLPAKEFNTLIESLRDLSLPELRFIGKIHDDHKILTEKEDISDVFY
jgi:hypothetical protein